MGILHTDFDRPNQALPEFEKAYELGDRDPITIAYLALALLAGPGDDAAYQRAEALLDETRGLSISPVWFARGLILRRQGRYREARQQFQRLLKEDPQQQRALFALAETYRMEHNVPAARTAMIRYNRVVRQRQEVYSLKDRLNTEGNRPELLARYGKALLEMGRSEEAANQLRKALKLNPHAVETRQLLMRATASKPGSS